VTVQHRALRRLIVEAIKHPPGSRSKIGVKNVDVRAMSHEPLARRAWDDVERMVTQAYASIGGNSKAQTAEAIATEYPHWILADIDDDPDVDVFVGLQMRAGREKICIAATDGSTRAKMHLLRLQQRLIDEGCWMEVSGAPAHILLIKMHAPYVHDERRARALLQGKDITWYGEHPEGLFPGTDGWYSRKIGAHEHIKIIVGGV
jgi:hypothetical protein